ncbi:hypothetical protein CRUP_018160 [Coryphaenoides rupestris]|nr:hypothetical protein CRUP_018160 [Coryphaenoides rupestris]
MAVHSSVGRMRLARSVGRPPSQSPRRSLMSPPQMHYNGHFTEPYTSSQGMTPCPHTWEISSSLLLPSGLMPAPFCASAICRMSLLRPSMKRSRTQPT